MLCDRMSWWLAPWIAEVLSVRSLGQQVLVGGTTTERLTVRAPTQGGPTRGGAGPGRECDVETWPGVVHLRQEDLEIPGLDQMYTPVPGRNP